MVRKVKKKKKRIEIVCVESRGNTRNALRSVMVNFMHQVDWAMGSQIVGQTLFWAFL